MTQISKWNTKNYQTRTFIGGKSWMICLMLVFALWSCSSKEDKLEDIELPVVEMDSTKIDTQMHSGLLDNVPSTPIVEPDVSPKEKPLAKRKKEQDEKTKKSNIQPPAVPEQPMVTEEEKKPEKEEIFMRAEQMPRFPGCEHYKVSEKEKAKCAEQKLFEYIRASLKYPPQALKNNLEGEVLIKFVVDKTGNIEQTELISDPGSGMGKAALEVVDAMKDFNQKWTPGYQHGKPVSVWFVLPVRFSLGDRPK